MCVCACVCVSWFGAGGAGWGTHVWEVKKQEAEDDFEPVRLFRIKLIRTDGQRHDGEVHDGKIGPGFTGKPAGSHWTSPTAPRDDGKNWEWARERKREFGRVHVGRDSAAKQKSVHRRFCSAAVREFYLSLNLIQDTDKWNVHKYNLICHCHSISFWIVFILKINPDFLIFL